MQKVIFFVLFLAAAPVTGTSVTPVQKVIEMLTGMVAKGKKAKHEEQVSYAAYKQWCDSITVEKQKAIKEANQQIEMLDADIQKYEAESKLLTQEIAKLDEDVATASGDQKAATRVRETEKADYMATHQDYSESIDALERAIEVLKKQSGDRAQAGAALAQLKSIDLIPAESKRVIDAFIAEDNEVGTAVAAPEANAYEFQSQGVVDLLEKLKDKFQDERTDLEKEETGSRHAYDMLMQDLGNQVSSAEDGRSYKSQANAKKLQAAANAKGDLEDTTTTRDDDQKYLSDTVATCQQKSSDFGNRQGLRADEITALEKALEILGGEAVSGAADKHLPGLIDLFPPTNVHASSFAQLRRTSALSPVQERAAAYLEDQAKVLDSRVLSALATHANSDPFDKVKKMIKDLIARLLEEANEEADHKGWCDTELSTNEQTRKEKTTYVEGLHSEIDELQASIAKLTHSITELTQQVADIDAAVADASKIREAEKTKNTETIKDAEEAQTAVAQAVTVLKEFYAKAADATSLAQQPETFDTAYKGMGAQSGGVVGILEVIQSDFARLQSETESAESQGQKEFDTFMEDSAVDKSAKTKDLEHKASKKQNEEQSVAEKKTDLENGQKELDAALAYYDKLKPSCVDSGVSYDDRVQRRKEEIQSLQEALKILNGEDVVFVQQE